MPIQGGTVRWIIEADDSQFNQTADNVEKKAEELTSKLDKKKSSNFWSNIIGDTKGVGSAMKQMGSSLASIGWGTFQAGATGAVGALTALLHKGIQATDFLETSRTAMAGLTGSIEAGNRAMSIAANYWQNNPFQRIDVTNATKQLVQFGRTTNQIGDDLEILGNVSLSTGTSIDELARYYARVSASGRAMTMDLEMMSDRGIPIYRELAEQLHTTQQGVRDLASAGKIDFETFRKAMEGAVNPEAMESFENTLSRQTDRLKGSIQILAGQLSGYKIINDQLVISENGLEKAWTRLLKVMATELRSDKMKDAMEKIGNALAKVIDKVTEFIPLVMNGLSKAVAFIGDNSATLLPILGGVLALMGKIGGGLPVIGPIIQSISGNVKGLFGSFKELFSLNPLLGTFLAIFAGGIIPALKNSEEFRNAIKELLAALGKLAQSLGGAFKNILRVVTTILSSDAVVGILTLIAQLLAKVAEVIASFPTNVLTTIVTAFLMFNLMKASPLAGYTVALLAFISVIKKFGPQILESLKSGFEAIKNFFATLGQNFANAAKGLANAGHNLMVGLANGIAEGSQKVFDYIREIGTNIVKYFKQIMGIHSPSTVMAEQGKYITLGLAEGITDKKSVVQKAMDSLASDILETIEKVVNNKVDFGLLDYSSQYKEWQKISKMFTAGSQQYQYAIRKMEEARKQANLQILSLQKEYNDALDSTISKISSAYGLFDSVDTTGGKGAEDIISDLDQQVAMLQEFASNKEIISGLDLADGLKEELQNMGVDASRELASIAGMTGDQLSKLNELWLKKQEQSNRAAITEMGGLKDQTLKKVDEIKKGIDGETVSLVDSGGRLVESITEGVYGTMPTLESAFSQMNDYIAKAAKELGKDGDLSDVGSELSDDLMDSLNNGLDEMKDEFQISAKELGDSLISSLGGIVLGIAAFQFGPKIISALGGTKVGGKIGGFFKNLFGSGSVAKEAAEAVSQSGTIAKSGTSIGNNMKTMSSGMTKVDKVFGYIMKGAASVILIAGAIAAMAGALKLAYELMKDINLGELLKQMGTLALVLVAAGVVMGVIGAFAKYVALGAIASLAISGGLLLSAMALAEVGNYVSKIDLGEILKLEGIIAIVSVIMTAIAGFAVFGAIGSIASAILSGGLLVSAMALAGTSDYVSKIKMDDIVRLSGILAEVSIILGLISGFAIFGAISSIANTILSGGLLLSAMALAETSKYVPMISKDNIIELSGILVEVDIILGLLSGFAVFGAIGSVANTILSGGLLLCTLALVEVSKVAPDVDKGQLIKLSATIGVVDGILGLLSGFAVLGAIGAVANDIIAGGLLIATKALVVISKDAGKIEQSNIDNLLGAMGKINSILALLSTFSVFSAIGTIITDVIVGGVKYAAEQLMIASTIAKGLNQEGVNKLQEMLTTIASWNTGDLFSNLSNLMNSGLLSQIASNVRSVIESISSVKPVSTAVVDSLKANITSLSQMKIEGSGLFENKGGAAQELVTIVRSVAEIARILHDAPKVDYGKTENFINSIKLFDRIDDKCKDGIKRLKDLGDALGNINWIKSIFGDVPDDIWGRAKNLVDSVKLFDRIDDNARNGALKLKDMKDSLGNIDWIKHIFGDVPEDMPQRAESLVNAIKKLSEVSLNPEEIAQSLAIVAALLNKIKETITNTYGTFRETGNNIAMKIGEGIRDKFNDIVAIGANLVIKFTEGMKSKRDILTQAGKDVQGAIWSAIEPKLQDEYYQGQALANKLKEGFESVSFSNSGVNAVNGFINGANGDNSMRAIYRAGYNIADRFLAGLKDRAGEHSPWKTTQQSGIFAGAGLAEGIAKSTSLVVSQAESLVDEVTDVMSMDDITVSPDFVPNVGGVGLPLMGYDEGFAGGRSVEINQTNNNYTNYSMRKINDDLRWELSKI